MRVSKRVNNTLRGIQEKTCETDSVDEKAEDEPIGHFWNRKKVKVAKLPVSAIYNEKIDKIRKKENPLKLVM